ncbi:Membrane protein implicated in regulation of membrane protease activity [Methanobrevibacter olleyae]|uniref:Membrane protein implicated in regulation of membrane protease activity n=1 Tax=Methanobrevibacter olleyae TaxID=294671 RepID=A0A1I4H024_METOL|nr:NfeD family protein [Methanobrevibacter olleyae]SFL35579.1 Membrane protein implicated in regulation of membrane protease activity [Methanobrevibacter olleyae]
MYFEFWIILAIILLIGELLTGGFYLLSIGIGSIVAAILNYLQFSITVQIIAFILITLIFILISRPLYKELNKNTIDKKSNTERLVGLKAKVTEDIDSHKIGTIIVNGEVWKAISDEKISKEEVEILEIEGVKLKVKKSNN